MKSIIAGILSLIYIVQPLAVFADSDATLTPTKFIVTAYYSPLPNQSYYMKGSYEADLALNGNGTNGASGKEVYIGMLAAPKKYVFGTKIHLDGLGVGVVDDRWGAIVPAWARNNAYDRIDIWMGSGEEGLRRALQWGRRTVSGKILDDGEPTLSVDSIPLAPKSAIAALRIESDSDGIFDKTIDKKSSLEDIKNLQQTLADLGYYKSEIDGKWSRKIIDAIYDFQVAEKLVGSVRDYGAGYYGLKTREALAGRYAEYQKQEEIRRQEERNARVEQEKKDRELAAKKDAIRKEIATWWEMRFGDIGPQVRALQKTLKRIGYLDEADTAIFGEKTLEALLRFQKDMSVIEDCGIGVFWSRSRLALADKLIEYQTKNAQ